MAIIDLSNYATTLVPSTQGRAGTPDGNVFFDTATGKMEFLAADEVATLDLTSIGGGATDPNPLIRADGIKLEAAYAFENQERRSSAILGEALRKFDRFISGTFKFGGAYNYVNGNTPSDDTDRKIVRSSGWNEIDASGSVTRIYFGAKGLSNINAGSQPSYQLAIQGTSTDFTEVGQIDEAVQVFGDASNGNFDSRTYMAVSIRTYGQNHDRKETTTDLGIAELGGYFTGFALNESVHLTTSEGTYPVANVYNATRSSQTGVWLDMALNNIAAPVVKSGEFSDETGTRLFSWELINDNGANLDECVAWLDAFAINTDEADELGVVTGNLGKDVETWYSYNASGQVVTKSGVTPASEGLYINNIPTADQQRVVFTDDGGTVKAYSFTVSVEATIGATAKADAQGWYHSWFAAAYNSVAAVVVQDTTPAEVKGNSSAADGNDKIIFAFDYTGDTNGGSADTDKNCVFLCEGDGGATQAKTLYTITKNTTVAFACAPSVENNV